MTIENKSVLNAKMSLRRLLPICRGKEFANCEKFTNFSFAKGLGLRERNILWEFIIYFRVFRVGSVELRLLFI